MKQEQLRFAPVSTQYSQKKYMYSFHLSLNPKALFGCCRIHFNPCVLVWIGVEFSSNFTPIHLNTCGLM